MSRVSTSILCKLAAILATYGILLWVMRPLGMIGIIAALISATCASGIVFLARRSDVVPVIRVCIGAFLGVMVAVLIPCAGSNVRDDCEISNATIFAVIGMLIAMLISAFDRLR